MVLVKALPPTTKTVLPYSLSLLTSGMKSLSPLTMAKAFTCGCVKAISSASRARLMSPPFLSPRGEGSHMRMCEGHFQRVQGEIDVASVFVSARRRQTLHHLYGVFGHGAGGAF